MSGLKVEGLGFNSEFIQNWPWNASERKVPLEPSLPKLFVWDDRPAGHIPLEMPPRSRY